MSGCYYPSCMMGGMGCADESKCIEEERKRADWMGRAMQIINEPGTARKIKRALLREELKLSETTIDELCPKEPPHADY